jgi:hypothetical protein
MQIGSPLGDEPIRNDDLATALISFDPTITASDFQATWGGAAFDRVDSEASHV